MKNQRNRAFLNRLKQRNKTFMLKISHFFKQTYNDLLILSGLFFIIYATFSLNKVAGFYCLGIILFGLGIWFTFTPPERR